MLYLEFYTLNAIQIAKSVIEANEEYFRSINLLFRWSTAATGILDHCMTLEGLVIGDDPCYVNLVIDRSTASLSPSISSTLSRADRGKIKLTTNEK